MSNIKFGCNQDMSKCQDVSFRVDIPSVLKVAFFDQFEDDQIKKFENESILSAEVFEQSTKGENEHQLSDNEEEESTDDVHEKFCKIGEKEVFEPLKSDEVDWQHHQTTPWRSRFLC